MDWLRIGAFGLLIFYHIGMFFVHWGWHVKAQPVLEWVAVPMLFASSWRLSLLFLVSGNASAAILERRPQPGAFLADRSARLMVPLAFGAAVIVPPQPWVELVSQHGYPGGFLHFWTTDYLRFGRLEGIVLPTWQHLWFVVYLWLYTLVLVLALWLLPSGARRALGRMAERVLGNPLGLALVPLGWLLAKALVLWPGAEETHDLVGDLPMHTVYFPMLATGFVLRRRPAIWTAVRRVWPAALAIALVAYAGIAAVELRWPGDTRPPEYIFPIFAALRAVHGWGTILALLGLAARYLNRDAPGRAMLTEAVFPFYLVHQTIIVVVAWWCLQAGLGNGAIMAVLLASTVLGCWLFYRIGREVPGLRVLIGLKGFTHPR